MTFFENVLSKRAAASLGTLGTEGVRQIYVNPLIDGVELDTLLLLTY